MVWDCKIINTISSVNTAHDYMKLTLDKSILFSQENSPFPTGSKHKPQYKHYVCRDMIQQGKINK
jgi:hypothetical protein